VNYSPDVSDDVVRSPEDLFEGFPATLAVLGELERAVSDLDEISVRVTKSQVAFRRRKGFAYLWRPGQYLASDVPAVVSIALDHEVESERFKEVAHPAPTVWMHHLEIRDPGEVDDEVRGWLADAYAGAG
jgi:hypothetical protein